MKINRSALTIILSVVLFWGCTNSSQPDSKETDKAVAMNEPKLLMDLKDIRDMVTPLNNRWKELDLFIKTSAGTKPDYPIETQAAAFRIDVKEVEDILMNLKNVPNASIAGVFCYNDSTKSVSVALVGINANNKPVVATGDEKWPTIYKVADSSLVRTVILTKN